MTFQNETIDTIAQTVREARCFMPDNCTTIDASISKALAVRAHGIPSGEVHFVPGQWMTIDTNAGKFLDVRADGKSFMVAKKDKLNLR